MYDPVSRFPRSQRFIRSEFVAVRNESCVSQAEMEVNQQFRSTWEQHVEWTRMLIISIAEGLKDEPYVTNRLLRNPGDMAAIFRRYYGDEIADKFQQLMTNHLLFAAQLVKAAKAGDSRAAMEAETKWYANADEIASFMSRINPYWPKADIQQMLYEHLRLTKAEAVARLGKKYERDIQLYDEVEQQALGMADAFAAGIVQQFPHQFR